MRNKTLTAFIFRVRKEQLTFASTSNNYFVELCQNLPNSPVQPFIQKPDKTRQGILSFCSGIKNSSSELKPFNPTSTSHNRLRDLQWLHLVAIPAGQLTAWLSGQWGSGEGGQECIEVTWENLSCQALSQLSGLGKLSRTPAGRRGSVWWATGKNNEVLPTPPTIIGQSHF